MPGRFTYLPMNYTQTQDGYGPVLRERETYSITPARYDIAALQTKLGINSDTAGDGTVFGGFKVVQAGQTTEYQTIFDAGGANDVIDASNCKNAVHINLEPGTASSIGALVPANRNVVIAFGTIIENAIGGREADIIFGNDVANHLEGRKGKDVLAGQAGDDILEGGAGNDTLKGGADNDTYVIGAETEKDTDTIIDSDGKGQIKIGNKDAAGLKGTTKVPQPIKAIPGAKDKYIWVDETNNSIYYAFKKTDNLSTGGDLEIYRKSGASQYQAIGLVKDFKSGNLGISLATGNRIAIVPSAETNPFLPGGTGAAAHEPLSLLERLAQNLKAALNSAACAGDKIKIALTGGDNSAYSICRGDSVISLADGPVTLDLAEGQTDIAFSFLNTGDVDTDTALTLTATYVPADGSGEATYNLTINLDASDEAADPVTALDITGDIIPIDIDPSKDGIQALGDLYDNPLGDAGAYGDILHGSTGNDHLLPGALGDDVFGGAGDDWIEGADGNDYLAGEAGRDRLEGGTGSDILSGGEDDDRLYGAVSLDIAAAITQGNQQSNSGLKGDWLSGGSGNDTLIAGADNDALAGGTGSDLLIGGAGDDNLLGDSDYTPQYLTEGLWRYDLAGTKIRHSSSAPFDWGYTDVDGKRVFAPVAGDTNPPGGAADVIYAGAGDDYAWAGRGDDHVQGEDGDDMLIGEEGNDVLLGGTGNDTLAGDAGYLDASLHGSDFLDGGEGDDQLVGGGAGDVLYGGAGHDLLVGDDDDLPDTAQGADYLDGEDGNDTVIGSEGHGTPVGIGGRSVLFCTGSVSDEQNRMSSANEDLWPKVA